MITTIEKYINATPIQLPYVSNFQVGDNPNVRIRLTRVAGLCRRCGIDVVDPRGRLNEYPTCLDLDYAGTCPQCGKVSQFRYRWYPLQGRIVELTANGWEETYTAPDRPYVRFLNAIRRLIGRFCG